MAFCREEAEEETMEKTWDQRLQIQTTGRDASGADQHHHPYEPTPYSVLERLADSGLIRQGDVLLDYGCGKGRVDFFLAYKTNADTIGIEYDSRIFQMALENRQASAVEPKPEFILTRAENYAVPKQVNRCYFFNPFTEEILQKVMARILESYYENPREIFLFFYYPADAYVACLMQVDQLEFYDEISCEDLFPGKDPRERILIFQIPE
jgi:SAM-dependent methyltransferase